MKKDSKTQDPDKIESDQDWMKEALALAEQAGAQDEVPVGAVVIHQGRVIGRGLNQRERLQSPTAHAEVLAIEEAAKILGSWRLVGCALYVTLEPCPMCLAAAQQARIEQIVYGTEDPKGGALSLGYRLNEDTRTNHRFPTRLHPTESCREILKTFFARKRSSSK